MMEPGTLLLQRYLIEKPIARGGMGAVYIATDQKFGSVVAIKERIYEAEDLAEAFEREARLLNNLHHPILPHVSDYFFERGRHFLVMEYIEGEDLSETLKREGAFPAADVVQWTLELLDGLDYLHSQEPPVIHRDIKPGNLKLTSRGNIVLLDFGLAKESSGNTLAGRSVFGYSRRYSPLEQIEGIGTDARSDIFSLGATVFHLITGQPPIDVIGRASSIVAGRSDPLRRADEVNSLVPASIAGIIHSALALNPDDRFASANAMRSALEHALRTVADSSAATSAARETVPDEEKSPTAASGAARVYRIEGFEKSHGIFETKADVNASRTPMMKIPEKRVQVRVLQPFWRRSAVWAAVLIGALIFLTFVIYRSTAPDEDGAANASELSLGTEREQAEKNEEVPQGGEEVLPDPEEAVTSEAATEIADPEPQNAPARSEPSGRNVPRKSEGDILDAPEPVERRQPLPARSRLARQPTERGYRPNFDEDPPVAVIESIFSGIDPERERRRELRYQRRQMSDWEWEDRRERRVRDILRRTRRPFPH